MVILREALHNYDNYAVWIDGNLLLPFFALNTDGFVIVVVDVVVVVVVIVVVSLLLLL